jgi:hypothetical protein
VLRRFKSNFQAGIHFTHRKQLGAKVVVGQIYWLSGEPVPLWAWASAVIVITAIIIWGIASIPGEVWAGIVVLAIPATIAYVVLHFIIKYW